MLKMLKANLGVEGIDIYSSADLVVFFFQLTWLDSKLTVISQNRTFREM